MFNKTLGEQKLIFSSLSLSNLTCNLIRFHEQSYETFKLSDVWFEKNRDMNLNIERGALIKSSQTLEI